MNEDIRKFWEDAGYTVENSILGEGNNSIIYYYVFRDGRAPAGSNVIYTLDNGVKEYFLLKDRFVYTEVEMLRIIKMKMFI